ncbi:hypothetical protein [Aquimarina sp. 2201CG14-23]|uniref:hypothetical protein n=1 Tax=Aquimarina mycalae TaxID=3040073 RepID=UPI002477E719|nr:hypothetical protein [Aquimarina sp. 2201CG14-23]MDH7447343.1 hypothetical protein [Aquimarina sp. 2201CG14-23]
MKKVVFLAAVITLSVFCACERETVDNTIVEESIDWNTNTLDETDGKANWGRCYYYVRKGLKFGGTCYSQFIGICDVYRICIPELVFDPCQFVPCWIDIFDPWIIYEKIDPREFISFRDKLDLKIDPRENVFPFALNEGIAGLQFYQDEGFLRDNTFNLEEDLILDAETSKELGLHGNVIKAGKYPVIINERNKTFNAILAVEKGFER